MGGRSMRKIDVGGLTLLLTAARSKLVGLDFAAACADLPAAGSCDVGAGDSAVLDEAERQLREYFAGVRRVFRLPIELSGTPFRLAVWEALLRIPYGEVKTYGEIAHEVGRPRAARAVGGACHANPIAIIVPCHRVVGAGGALAGFGGGLDVKERLLALERAEKQ